MMLARTQPPVGYPTPFGHLARAAFKAAFDTGDATERVSRDFADALGVRRVFPLSSGKAALAVALTALRSLSGRRKVVLPAYTCYSVPSAIVKCGLDPIPCDLAAGGFDYDYQQLATLLTDDVLCVLSVHLFGIPSDTRRVTQLCRPRNIYVLEDAAQALGGVSSDGVPLGTLGDVSVFSFGRGKNVSCGGGGCVVTNSEPIAGRLDEVVRQLPGAGLREEVRALVALGITSVFVSPSLYWFPASLPFLRLGETIFYEDFPVRRFSAVRFRLLEGWRTQLTQLNAARRNAAEYYLMHVSGARDHGAGIPYLRFPVAPNDPGVRRRLLADGTGRRLGISAMYPASVARIPQLSERTTMGEYPEADRLSSCMFTLPTHGMLKASDLAAIADAVNGASGQTSP